MIRYKDKTFDQYSICPATGDIFDSKTGEVQKTYLKHKRPHFKQMPVHCIMAHTFYGYKNGFDVHHQDENKLNNSLSNLVYLTRSEHRRLHMLGKTFAKGKERIFSEEHKAKISAALKGKLHPHKGKKHGPLSEEHKAKISATQKGKKRGPYNMKNGNRKPSQKSNKQCLKQIKALEEKLANIKMIKNYEEQIKMLQLKIENNKVAKRLKAQIEELKKCLQ